MKKRYHASGSGMISETSGFCHLPDQVINKEYPSHDGIFDGSIPQGYSCVESQMKSDRQGLISNSSPKKF